MSKILTALLSLTIGLSVHAGYAVNAYVTEVKQSGILPDDHGSFRMHAVLHKLTGELKSLAIYHNNKQIQYPEFINELFSGIELHTLKLRHQSNQSGISFAIEFCAGEKVLHISNASGSREEFYAKTNYLIFLADSSGEGFEVQKYPCRKSI